jgi:hypothetical protein
VGTGLASRTSSQLLSAVRQGESKKEQARASPQDRDGYGKDRRAEQDHTQHEYQNNSLKHVNLPFLSATFISQALAASKV